MAALTLNLNSISNISRSQFRQIATDNPDMKLERNKQGHLIVMAPTGGETGNFNFDLNGQLYLWNRNSQLGKAFGNCSTRERLTKTEKTIEYLYERTARHQTTRHRS
jgi:Uma2 family endonuclease